MKNLHTTDARSGALKVIANHFDLDSYLCPVIFLDEFDDDELTFIASKINDYRIRYFLDAGLSACEDMCSIDGTDSRLVQALHEGAIDETHEYFLDALEMDRCEKLLSIKHRMIIRDLKRFLFATYNHPSLKDKELIVDWSNSAVA